MSHAHDMYFRPVEADGNCLFRAASVALSGDFELSREEETRHATQLRSDAQKQDELREFSAGRRF